MSLKQFNQNIQQIDDENNDLKYKLLNLINEYKVLKLMVLNNEYKDDKKRSYQQLDEEQDHERLNHENLKIIKEDEPLIINKHEIFDFIDDEEIDDDEMDSPVLSRTSSPLDDDNNSLMLSLTRSTTISSMSNSVIESKPQQQQQPHVANHPSYQPPQLLSKTQFQNQLNSKSNFFDLPSFSEGNDLSNLNNQFDILKQDKYNLINDFLQEKLINNDLNYYESLKYQD